MTRDADHRSPAAMAPPTQERYRAPAQWLHWLIAALIVLQFVLAELAERADEAGSLAAQLGWLADHKSVGMTILCLAIVRLAFRWRAAPPPPLPAPHAQQLLAKLTHGLLYLLLFALPLTGWLGSSAAAYSVSWFGWFTWPDLVAADPALREQLYVWHERGGNVLAVLAGLHLAAAIKHHYVDRDTTLMRMTSPASLTLFAVALGAGLSWITLSGASTGGAAPTSGVTVQPPAQPALPTAQTEQAASQVIATTAAEPALPSWAIDYERSRVTFSADQAGASFDGTWQRWEADIRFSAAALTQSRAKVSFDATSAATNDADRDSTLTSSEFFAAERFPAIVFKTDEIRRAPQDAEHAFTAAGSLLVKGVSVPVVFDFSVTAEGTQRQLTGQARLDRLVLGIGTGDWADPASIGQFVDVRVSVTADVRE